MVLQADFHIEFLKGGAVNVTDELIRDHPEILQTLNVNMKKLALMLEEYFKKTKLMTKVTYLVSQNVSQKTSE